MEPLAITCLGTVNASDDSVRVSRQKAKKQGGFICHIVRKLSAVTSRAKPTCVVLHSRCELVTRMTGKLCIQSNETAVMTHTNRNQVLCCDVNARHCANYRRLLSRACSFTVTNIPAHKQVR